MGVGRKRHRTTSAAASEGSVSAAPPDERHTLPRHAPAMPTEGIPLETGGTKRKCVKTRDNWTLVQK